MYYESYDAVVIGSGAAGFSCAYRLNQFGKSVAIVTEGIFDGTSRNTGSDKQTYYKLGLAGDRPDSVLEMAKNLFSGGSMDGDTALVEAALSARSFLNLCELGVPFPVNRYGEYVGYKTDHDPYARATSAGPLTSKFMTEALETCVKERNVPVFDGLLAIEVLKTEEGACGVLCLERKSGRYVLFRCGNVVLCTGGPAGIYADRVYPKSQSGMTSLAILAGAKLQNLTEWQFGLASVAPLWNVSGTYMQVLPRFVSIDEHGEKREFLQEAFSDPYEALSLIFLKGYQWPFDSRKILHGSSLIDLLVYRECTLRKRRVFLDYTENPFGLKEIDFKRLAPEAGEYLKKAEAAFGTPFARLEKMNRPAVELYFNKGVDLSREMLEIALCAQHHNGGISVDLWWQSSVCGLFAAGECAGTHGVSRPGGSALNSGQVGALRAASFISRQGNERIAVEQFERISEDAKNRLPILQKGAKGVNLKSKISLARRRMSDAAGAIRNLPEMKEAYLKTKRDLEELSSILSLGTAEEMYQYFKFRDLLLTQAAVLVAMIDYAETHHTRGSALYTNPKGEHPKGLEEFFSFYLDDGESGAWVQETIPEKDGLRIHWRSVRPIPENDDFFENVWRNYRENQNIY